MNVRRKLLFTLCLALTSQLASAQESASHIRTGDWEGGNSPLKAADMAKRIQQAVGGQSFPGQQIDPALIKQLLDRIQKNPELLEQAQNDPKWLEKAFEN